MTDQLRPQTFTTPARLGLRRHLGRRMPNTFKVLFFFLMQAALALAIHQVNILSTLHAYVTLAVGLFLLITEKEPYKLMYWMGYVVAAELLWRGMGARVFWETGKYVVIVISLLGCLKNNGEYKLIFRLAPYFLLLVPAVLLMPTFNREVIAFALAGPLALVAASMFFSRYKIDTAQMKTLLLTILASVLTFSILVLLGLINAEEIEFSGASNYFTSANTGPNQVSSLLSLGAFSAFVYVLLERDNKFLRVLVALMGLGLLVQITLTFSRGGLYTFLGAIAVGGLFFMRDQKSRMSYLAVVVVGFLIFYFFLLPVLDQWTSGTLGARLSNIEPTGRLEIIRSDLEVFQENPLYGIGLGKSDVEHARYFRVSNAHTEYSRMLAEHGVLGLISLLILVVVISLRVFQKDDPLNKAVIVACMTWGLLFMAHSATRLVAPSFLIGLSFAHFDLSIPSTDAPRKTRFYRLQRIGSRTRFTRH